MMYLDLDRVGRDVESPGDLLVREASAIEIMPDLLSLDRWLHAHPRPA